MVPDKAVFLLIDDNEDDIALLRRAFLKSRVINPLHAVRSGAEAMAYLEGSGRYRNRLEFPLPKIILLDIKMQVISGLEVLKWIREQPQLAGIRVIMLTSSDLIRDVNEAYRLGANSFLIKPNDFDDLVKLTQAIRGYWVWTDVGPQISAHDHEREPRYSGP